LRGKVGIIGNNKGLPPVKDFLTSNGWLIREEGRIANHHFKHDHTHAPPVNSLIITMLSKNFRGNIVWGAYRREGKSSGPLISQPLVQYSFKLIKVLRECLPA
jgi:hypothetical protein